LNSTIKINILILFHSFAYPVLLSAAVQSIVEEGRDERDRRGAGVLQALINHSARENKPFMVGKK